MARYEHLPIYKTAMEMAVYLQNRIKNFSRYNKYSIGTELRDLSRKILLLTIQANSTTQKQVHLQELVAYCDMLKTTLIFAKEVNAFDNFKSFQHAAAIAVSLCKQSEGWLKSSKNGPNYQPSYKADR